MWQWLLKCDRRPLDLLLLQVVGTGMLVLCILAIVDGGNIGAPKGVEPLAIGLIIMAIGVSMGLNCGYPLNPARDLGPRLFTAVAGWGMEVFRWAVQRDKIWYDADIAEKKNSLSEDNIIEFSFYIHEFSFSKVYFIRLYLYILTTKKLYWPKRYWVNQIYPNLLTFHVSRSFC